MVDEIVVGFEDAIGEPVVAHELPDVFHRVEPVVSVDAGDAAANFG